MLEKGVGRRGEGSLVGEERKDRVGFSIVV